MSQTITREITSKVEAKELIESAVKNQPKKCGCRRSCGGYLVIFLILALPFWWFCLHTPSLKISKETTHVLGPMSSDGKQIDYFSALEKMLYPPEMKTDVNGFRMMVRACGVDIYMSRSHYSLEKGAYDAKLDPEPFRLQVYEKLGLDPNIKPTLKITSPWRLIEQYDNEHPQTEATLRMLYQYDHAATLTFEQFPMLQTWLEENTAGIDLLAEAVRKPVFCVPNAREKNSGSLTDSWLFQNGISISREWARAAYSRARYRLGIGDIDGAIDDTVTILRLARHMGKQGCHSSAIVGFAMESMGLSIGIASNPAFPPTAEQMKRLVTEIDALPPIITFKEASEYERIYSLAGSQDLFFDVNEDVPPSGLDLFYDVNVLLKKMNDLFDMLLFDNHPDNELFKNVSLEEFSNPSEPNLFFLLSTILVHSRSEMIANNFVGMSISALQESWKVWHQHDCAANMHRLTSALWLYEKEHGNMPEGDWREAIKPYLGENPEQYFRCPANRFAENETGYAMISDVPNASESPRQILLIEVSHPMKLGEGDGRISFEQAMAYYEEERRPYVNIGGAHDRRMIFGFRSGMVRAIDNKTSPEELRKLFDGTAETSMP